MKVHLHLLFQFCLSASPAIKNGIFLNENCAHCADASMEQNPTHLWLPFMHALYFGFY